MNWFQPFFIYTGMVLGLTGCGDRPPNGQIVATVNGEEIALGELSTEIAVRGIAGSDDPAVRNGVLQEIIDRKLHAQAAREQAIDRSPEFILQQQRNTELLLAEMLREVSLRAQPTDSDVFVFLQDNGEDLEERIVFSVDQIAFPRPSESILQQVTTADTLAGIERELVSAGVPFQRAQQSWDSVMMPDELLRQLRALPRHEPFLIPGEEGMLSGVILEQQVAPLGEEARWEFARQVLQQQNAQEALRGLLENERASATIEYQSGYAPKKDRSAVRLEPTIMAATQE